MDASLVPARVEMTLFLLAVYATFGVVLITNIVHLARTRLSRIPSAQGRALVSVIVPARNEAENLAKLIPSVLGQSYGNLEVIVYDDDSQDTSAEVLMAVRDPRLHVHHGTQLPPGWVGKVHALYRATRNARGEIYIFLDADVVFKEKHSLARLVERVAALGAGAVLSGITDVRGGGQLLVSLVPFLILTWLPLPLAERLRSRWLSGLNGQCWLVHRDLYHRLEPHLAHRGEVLEDIRIGRYLKAHGATVCTVDLRNDITVHMYRSLSDAWVGFRKNVYPFMGESIWSLSVIHAFFVVTFVTAPLVSPWFLLSAYVLKLVSDRFVGVPFIVTLATPVSLVLGAVLQLDSAFAHWSGRAWWKGRPVARRSVETTMPSAELLDARAGPHED